MGILGGIYHGAMSTSLWTGNMIYTALQNARTKKEVRELYNRASEANFKNRSVAILPSISKQQLLLTTGDPNENDIYDYQSESATAALDYIWGEAEDPESIIVSGGQVSERVWNERLQTIVSGGEVPTEAPDSYGAETNLPTTAEEAAALMIDVPQQVSTVSDKLTRSLGPAVFVDEDHYMIDNLLFVGDEIPAEAEAIYGTRMDNQPAINLKIFENVAEDRVNKHVLPSIDENGNTQYPDPALKVKMIGDLRLELPPNTLKGTPIRVVFRSSAIGLEVTATNLETNESAETVITTENTMSKEELDEARARFANIKTSGQI